MVYAIQGTSVRPARQGHIKKLVLLARTVATQEQHQRANARIVSRAVCARLLVSAPSFAREARTVYTLHPLRSPVQLALTGIRLGYAKWKIALLVILVRSTVLCD